MFSCILVTDARFNFKFHSQSFEQNQRKYVLIGCMFIGRIGILNLMDLELFAFVNESSVLWNYPKKILLIN